VIVTLPETLPVTEAMELEQGLARHKLPVSAIVVNRVPRNPFSADERKALGELLNRGDSPVFGARELRRIERAEAALALLREQHPDHAVVLPEVDGTGAEAVSNLMPLL
jgi:hypothetical protein